MEVQVQQPNQSSLSFENNPPGYGDANSYVDIGDFTGIETLIPGHYMQLYMNSPNMHQTLICDGGNIDNGYVVWIDGDIIRVNEQFTLEEEEEDASAVYPY